MRNFLAGLVVVSLAVAPALATIDVQLLANASTSSGNLVAGTGTNNLTLNVGQTAVVGGFFVGNGHGVVAIGGSVVASGASALGTGTGFAYLSSFQGFQGAPDGEGGIVPGTTILPTTPTLAVNGAVSPIGSAQGTLNVPQTQFYDTYAATTPKQLFSYTVTATAPGVVTLQWQEAPAGGFSGWYTTDFTMVNGVNNNAALTITVPQPVTQVNLVSSSVDNAVAGKKTISRAKKAIVRLTFDGSIGTVGTITNPGIKIVQCLAGGVEGTDVTSNFTFAVEAGNVLKIADSTTTGALTNKTWYAIRNTGSWTGAANFTKLTPVLIGDVDGNGILTSAGDVGPIVTKLASPSFGTVDDDRRDLDGNKICTSAGDVGPAVTGLSAPSLPAKPSGW